MPTKSRFPSLAGLALDRRNFLFAAGASLLASCSSDPQSDTAEVGSMIRQSLGLISGDQGVSLEEVAKVPYASVGVRVGSGTQIMLVLASRLDQSLLWTSAAHLALETRYGRIVRTAGLAHDLSATNFITSDPLAQGLQNLKTETAAMRRIDLADRDAFQIPVQSTFSPKGEAEIDILGTQVKTLRAVEHCVCAEPSWTFTNEYWADPGSGVMWRSIQFVHPDLDPLEVETFRPARV